MRSVFATGTSTSLYRFDFELPVQYDEMEIITAPSPDQVEAFRNLRKQWRDQLNRGFFYAEGEQVFARLLASTIEIVSVLLIPSFLEKYWHSLESRSCVAYVADKSWIEQNTMQKLNQGILALARIPPPFSLSTLNAQDRFCVVALNEIDHAVNVGTILRNCAAFDAAAVIVDAKTVHPYCWRSVKSSLGGVFKIPVLVSPELDVALKALKAQGVSLVAADPSASILTSKMSVSNKVCLILGNEHRGISSEVMSLAAERIAIPMSPHVDSLNVAAASAILLYELTRQS